MANGNNNLPPDPSNFDPRNQQALNKFAQENAKIAAEITNEARSLTEELKDQLGIRSRLNETERSTLNLARQLQSSAAQNTVEIGNSGNIQRQLAKDTKLQLSIEREINDLKSTASAAEIKFAEKISTTNDKINEIQKELAEATGKRADDLKDQLAVQEDILKFSLEDAKSSVQRLALAMSMSKTTAKLIAQRQAESDIQDDITDRMGVTGALVKGTGALMERLGMRSGIFQKAMQESAEAMREMAEETERGEASFSKTEIMLKGFSVLSKGFGQALLDPFTIATAIIDAFIKINKQQVKVSRLTGQLGTNFSKANAAASFEGAATAIDRLETIADLTEEIGLNAQNAFSAENIQGAANLKLELGLTADQAGSLAVEAQAFGGSVNDVRDNIVGVTNEFNAANRTAVSQGQILRDIGNTSADIRAQFGGNVDELVKGAAAARKLGMEIGELDDIASSLLDFEQSIQNELEAQLLTGKNINMNKARELALSNDLAGLGEELFKNSADIAEFGKMNRIQQEAQAKALGMSREQLAKVAYQQALNLKMTEEQAAAAAGVNVEDMRRLEAQENFAKAIEKITTALSPILNLVGDILSMPMVPYLLMGALAAKKLGGSVLGAVQGIGSLAGGVQGLSGGFKDAMKAAGGFGKFIQNKLLGNKIGGQFIKGGGRAAKGARAGIFGKGGMFEKVGGAFKKGKDSPGIKGITGSADATKGVKPEQGTGIKGFLKGLGDGLASIGRQFTNVIKGSIAVGIAGLALGGSFALALRMVKDIDPVQMIAFAGSLSMLGLTLALLGKIGSSVIQGALAMGILGVGLIPAAFAFSLLAGVDTKAMTAFSIALPLLGLAAAGLGFLAPFIIAGAGAIAVLGAAMIPAALAFKLLGDSPIESIIQKLSGLAAIAPQLLLVGGALFSIAAGLGAIAVAGIAALPALAGLTYLVVAATPLLALGGLFGGDDEDSSMAEISSKLDTLISVVAQGGDVFLDGEKIGRTQAKGFSKLTGS
jgi:hypothetical protein